MEPLNKSGQLLREKVTFSLYEMRNSFRKVLSLLLIYSMICSSCAWAGGGPVHFVDEELHEPSLTQTLDQKVFVEPKTVRDDGAHVLFQSLQTPEDGHLIFTSPTDAPAVYARIYDDNLVTLAGCIESEAPLVMSNPGGIHLEGTEFACTPSLLLAAGHLQDTNQGLACDVDEGRLSLDHVLFAQEEAVQSLFLAGRRLTVTQSLLSPSENLSITLGKQVHSVNPRAQQWVQSHYRGGQVTPTHHSEPSLHIDESTTLRSNSIFLESLEDGAEIKSHGFLQSTEGDIVIRAMGDIHLDHLFANRNLDILTTGKVTFGKDVFVGGRTRIGASNITIDEWKSVGGLSLVATGSLNLKGSVFAGASSTFRGLGGISLNGEIEVKGALSVTSHGEIVQRASLFSEDTLNFRGSTKNLGTIRTYGRLEKEGEFKNRSQGTVQAMDFPHLQSLLEDNRGTIELLGDLSLEEDFTLERGRLVVRGSFQFGGDTLTLNEQGTLSALGGAFFDAETFINQGHFLAQGPGLEGKIGQFMAQGQTDLSRLSAEITTFEIPKNAAVRTSKTFDLKGERFTNNGSLFTLGLHKVDITGDYEDNGIIYTPNLSVLTAQNILYGSSHTSHLGDALVAAREGVIVKPGAAFKFWGPYYFLDLGGETTLFEGTIAHKSSGSFPVEAFFNLFGESIPAGSITKLREGILDLRCMEWIWKRNNLSTKLTLRAKNDLICRKAKVRPENGSVALVADGEIKTEGSDIASGSFKGNHIKAKGKVLDLNSSTLRSLFGKALVSGKDQSRLNQSQVLGDEEAVVTGKSVGLTHSTVTSSNGSAKTLAHNDLTLDHSTLSAGQETVAWAQGTATLRHSTQRGRRNHLQAHRVETQDSEFVGESYVQAQAMDMSGVTNVKGSLSTQAQETCLSGQIRGGNVALKGEGITDTSQKDTENIYVEATESYTDTEETANNARDTLILLALKNKGFKGQQKAGTKATVKVQSMDFFDFLDHVKAPKIVGDLGGTDVVLEEDYVLEPHLTLFARRFESKRHLRTKDDFYVKTQEGITVHDTTAAGNLGFAAGTHFEGRGMQEGESVSVEARGVRFERGVTRSSITGGYADSLGCEVGVRARSGNISITGKEWLRARAALFEAKFGHLYVTSPDFYIGSQQTATDVTWSDKRHYHHQHTETHHKSKLEGGLGIHLRAPSKDRVPSRFILEGVDGYSREGGIDAYSVGELHNLDVHNTYEEENHSSSKGGIFKKKKKKKKTTGSSTVISNTFKAAMDVKFISEEDNHQWVPEITTGGMVRIKSLQGKVFMHADKSYSFSSTEKNSKSLVWQCQAHRGHYDEYGIVARILPQRGTEISGAKGVEVDVIGGHVNQAVQRHLRSPETAWMKELQGRSDVIWRAVPETHDQWSERVEGLTPAAGAVIAIAVTCATAGAGAKLMGPVLAAMGEGTVAATAVNAAAITAMGEATLTATVVNAAANTIASTLASQAAVNIISNKGNLRAVIEDLTSQKSLRSLGSKIMIAAFSAGLCQHLDIDLGSKTSPQSTSGRIQEALVGVGVKTTVNATLGGVDVSDALLSTLRTEAANVAGGELARKVGLEYKDPEGSLNYITHKILHAAIGAGMGYATDGEPLSGAIGAAVGEIVGEAYADLLGKEAFDPQDEKRRNAAVQRGEALAQISAALAAGLFGEDAAVASQAALNAVHNNVFFLAIPAVVEGAFLFGSVALTVWEAYEVYDIYHTEGPEAAMEHFCLVAGLTVGTMGAGKVFGPILRPYAKAAFEALKDSPLLAKLFAQKSATLLLEKPNTVKHHIFNVFRGGSPGTQKYRDFFARHKIHIDAHTVEITEAFHRKKIHGASNDWTKRWKTYIDNNPDASTKDVYQFAGLLMDEYGISHVPIRKYR